MKKTFKEPLKPEKIYRLFREKQIDESSAIDNLIFIIKQSNKNEARIRSLDNINKIINEKHLPSKKRNIFNTLEEILISDLNEIMQWKAGIILVKHFLKWSESSLVWKFQRDISLPALIKILAFLRQRSPSALRRIILSALNDLINSLSSRKSPNYNGLNKYISFFRSVGTQNLISTFPTEDLIEIFLNFKIILAISKRYNLNKRYSKFFFYYVKEYGRCEIENGLITKLNLYDLGIQDLTKIKGLDCLKQLRVLEVSYNNLSEIKFPKTDLNMEELELWKQDNFKLKNINNKEEFRYKPSKPFQELKTLKLSSNSISEMKNLSHLPNLEKLDMGWNNIRKIQGIKNLKQLRELSLNNNKISRIENLEHLNNLKSLNLRHNNIKEIEGLDNLRNLSILYLQNNHITEIMGLENLKNLSILYLNNNHITEIKGLSNLPKLSAVYLNNNKIRDTSELETFPKYCCVFLDGNPIKNNTQE